MAARRWMLAIAQLVSLSLAGFASLAAAQESSTARVEKEITISADLALPSSAVCGASVAVEYFQANTVAKVSSTIIVEGCAASGEFTLLARIRDDAGEIKTLEFNETFSRTDEPSLTHEADYEIGENVELLSVRTRGVRCTCVEPPATEPVNPE